MTSTRLSTHWPSAQPILRDGVVNARPWDFADADWVFTACQDPEIRRWTTVPVPYTLDDAKSFVNEFAPDSWKNERGAHFAVVSAATGDVLGCVGVDVFDARSGVGEAGYWTAVTGRGTGATSRALQLLTDWGAFESLGLVRLELLIEVENVKSTSIAERVGYNREGVMAKRSWRAGAHRDVALYARTA